MSSPWGGLHYRRSLASRVTLLTTIAVGFAVSVVAFAAYATVRTQAVGSLDESLKTRANQVASTNSLSALVQQQVPTWALGAANVNIVLINANTSPLSYLSFSPGGKSAINVGQHEVAVARGTKTDSARTVYWNGQRWRMVAVQAGDGQAVVLAQSMESTDRLLDRLGLVMLLFGVAGMITAGLAGWGVARNGLRPVRRLTSAVEDIARTQRLDPIPIEGSDEVARLAQSFNEMLRALSASQHRQRQLVADAGHELRTPLTSLRTNLDLLVQADASTGLSPESRAELLDDVRAQIGEMTTLIGDLVELARDEPVSPTVEPVELTAILEQAIARVRRRADIDFDVRTTPWWVTGDADSLERAITNLLDNAAKWSPAGETVIVTLSQGTLMVADHGPGISAKDLPHVFERFYRSAESRSMPGSGLGLSIVRSVAERHGGIVRAGTGPGGGAGFWLSLPGQAAPPEASQQVLARS
ncbi:sensor histidine kinase [Nocardioides marmorisolisilvae]|uniref:histidine kinase n=1 Tax=Nocardioides marmorisolisilvae TaxID=1542737 RepID=A0A3N0DQ42_9ACTN|nr:HAMP domain-containing sensor histidine kinase [Nocardioides marmorisolisilvae]RNL77758.1 sensor histidine kinase [Nocardioides marmorisolisilvae]